MLAAVALIAATLIAAPAVTASPALFLDDPTVAGPTVWPFSGASFAATCDAAGGSTLDYDFGGAAIALPDGWGTGDFHVAGDVTIAGPLTPAVYDPDATSGPDAVPSGNVTSATLAFSVASSAGTVSLVATPFGSSLPQQCWEFSEAIDITNHFTHPQIDLRKATGFEYSIIFGATYEAVITPTGGAPIFETGTLNVTSVHSKFTGPNGTTASAGSSIFFNATNVAAELEEIVGDNPETPLADKVEDALAKVNTAQKELSKAPPDYQAVLGSIEGAVGDLEAAVTSELLDPVQGAELMDDLARFARVVATSAISDLIAQGGDPTEAELVLADGNALKALGAFKDAVGKYRDALAKAESALP